jgi:hypothetical protein
MCCCAGKQASAKKANMDNCKFMSGRGFQLSKYFDQVWGEKIKNFGLEAPMECEGGSIKYLVTSLRMLLSGRSIDRVLDGGRKTMSADGDDDEYHHVEKM